MMSWACSSAAPRTLLAAFDLESTPVQTRAHDVVRRSAMRLCRFVSLITAFTMLMIALTPSRKTEAMAIYQGSIEISARVCPADARKLIAECDQERGLPGVVIGIDETLPRTMDGTGYIRFDRLTAGGHLVQTRINSFGQRFRQIVTFCSYFAMD